MAKKALITGITGQDGSYLAELLLSKDYEVHGIIRRTSTFNTERIDHLYQDPHINGVRLFLHFGDMADSTNLIKLLYRIQPEEVYNLAAQSHVRVSFDIPEYTADVTGLGTVRILEAIRETSGTNGSRSVEVEGGFAPPWGPESNRDSVRPRREEGGPPDSHHNELANRSGENQAVFQEVTLEADPETVEEEKAAAWVRAGINRVSFGVQSFSDKELKAAGRMHRARTFIGPCRFCARRGFAISASI